MASSRWKRFAFFERKSLSLPRAVIDDVGLGVGFGVGAGGGISHRQQQDRLLRRSDEKDEKDVLLGGGGYADDDDDDKETEAADRFSMAVIGDASVPSAPTPSESSSAMKQEEGGYSGGGAGVKEMRTVALSPVGDNRDEEGEEGASLVLLFVSSRSSSRIHCVDVTGRCKPFAAPPSASARTSSSGLDYAASVDSTGLGGGGGDDDSVAAAEADGGGGGVSSSTTTTLDDLDGHRGAFDPFVDGGFPSDVSAAAAEAAAASAHSSSTMTPAERLIVEEHMGGDEDPMRKKHRRRSGRIVDVAACRVPVVSSSNSNSGGSKGLGGESGGGGSNRRFQTHVASITDAPGSSGVAVHVDPHWSLSPFPASSPPKSATTTSSSSLMDSRRHSSSLSSSSSSSSICYRPSSEFDFDRKGKPRCVSASSNRLVAVGTDRGTVVVYGYDGSDDGATMTSAIAKKKSAAAAATSSNSRDRRRFLASRCILVPVVEIPAPPSGGGGGGGSSGGGGGDEGDEEGGGYVVTSVRLVPPPASSPSSSSSSSTQHVGSGAAKQGTVAAATTRLFVTYRRRHRSRDRRRRMIGGGGETVGGTRDEPSKATTSASSTTTTTGVCCYDLGRLPTSASLSSSTPSSSASARYDLDARDVPSSRLCDVIVASSSPDGIGGGGTGGGKEGGRGRGTGAVSGGGSGGEAGVERLRYMVARTDGLYVYSTTDRVGVSPIDGAKVAVCAVPPPLTSGRRRGPPMTASGSGGGGPGDTLVGGGGIVGPDAAGAVYALVATTDVKSGRDAVDVYDASNKLVAFHALLSPGHRALRAIGVTTADAGGFRGGSHASTRGGRSSALVLTSGGAIVSLTEKVTSDKVNLLVQKNLYGAAISMAFADPSYHPADITTLYRRHAEHLYRKGDHAAAMDQYLYTVGSLEPSHVIFRFLDAPKIPLLVRYLEVLRQRGLASHVHDELLRTCYLKLNDTDAAEKIAASASASATSGGDAAAVAALLVSSSLSSNRPTEALAALVALDAPRAAEALVIHGPALARVLPRETAGVVTSLCDGTYSPSALADAAAGTPSRIGEGGVAAAHSTADGANGDRPTPACDRYPIGLFAKSFLENSRLLRLILAHCWKNRCEITPTLRRALLELTLEEWNHARRTGEADLERLRRDEAIALLTDPQANDIGDYEALVIVESAGFTEGEVLLYERLQMAPMLLERYAKDGGERARRQMLAMCRSEPELLADVLGYFVRMAAERMDQEDLGDDQHSEISENEAGEILDDISEALRMARLHGALPPVRIARILAGEGAGQFSVDARGPGGNGSDSVPLSVALDYVGAILDDSSKKISRLKADVEEYNQLCNSMEDEINSLLSSSAQALPAEDTQSSALPHINIEEMYAKLKKEENDTVKSRAEGSQEEFWREIGQHSEYPFETISRFFGKGIIQ